MSEQFSASPWWSDHRNLALVAEFMQSQGGTLSEIIYMVEKPWKHNDDYNLAQAEVEAERNMPSSPPWP